MYLSKFQLFNYKSFRDSKSLEFKPGINIIVGPNDSGKTALLEALSLNFPNHIHKSLKTFPFPSSDVVNPYSGYQLSLSVNKESIRLIIDKLPKSFSSPIITIPDKFKINSSYYELEASQALKNFLNDKNPQKDVEIQIRARASGEVIPFDSMPDFFSCFYNNPVENLLKEKEIDLTELTESIREYRGFFNINSNSEVGVRVASLTETIQYHIFQKYRNIIYKFDAQRVNSGTSQVGTSRILKPDTSNLAEVLSILQANRTRFEKFNKYVSTVIPSIKWINVSQCDGLHVEIKVWKLDPYQDREDLAYPLSDSGAGVSQVLAILYVVITSQEPKIIIIDELQTFLHPGAAKKLIGILKEFPQHQYFITTHSAEIITAANPSTIVNLQYKDGETQASTMNARDIREQRSLLAELGVSLSDVFGADNILWVEGPTEEQCFSLILEKVAPKLLTVTKIISVNNTGELLGKKARIAHVMFDLYTRISSGNHLYPPAIGFVFDKECLSDSDIEDLKRRRPHSIEFIKRRMYENYLLHPNAITFVLNEKDENKKQPLNEKKIKEWLDTNKLNKNYFSKTPTEKELSNPQWVNENIDAAKLLSALFAHFSDARVRFSKPEDSRMLTEWLVENNPDCFAELAQFLQHILDTDKVMIS
jgi:AAA15 family ATPase/GTPase